MHAMSGCMTRACPAGTHGRLTAPTPSTPGVRMGYLRGLWSRLLAAGRGAGQLPGWTESFICGFVLVVGFGKISAFALLCSW